MRGNTKRRRWLLPLAVVAFAVSLAAAACGGGGSDAQGSSTNAPTTAAAPSAATSAPSSGAPAASPTATAVRKDPCSYVSREEVQAATGKTVTSAGTKVNDFSCRWTTADSGTVNVSVASPVTKARFDDSVQANAGASATAIPGLGDEAFAIFFGVAVYKGNTSINVEVSPSTSQTGGDGAIALARLILTRI